MLNNQLNGPEGVLLGHRTIDEIGRQTLPVSPQNYEVWLTYMTHSSPDLRQAVDKLLASGKALTPEDMEQLYERFFSTTHLSTQVMETGSRIAHEIAVLRNDFKPEQLPAHLFMNIRVVDEHAQTRGETRGFPTPVLQQGRGANDEGRGSEVES